MVLKLPKVRIATAVLTLPALAAIALLSCVLAYGFSLRMSLPPGLFNDPVSPVLLSREGKLLGASIAADQQWRFPATERVPQKFKTALLTFEDKRFDSHWGVDLLALGRAMRQNINKGRVVSGASTLTMQVIRLARKNPRRTLLEKIKEMLLASRLEWSYDKDEILALYAANAPFGGNIVGLEAAAWRYFGRSAQQLSWAESAMLAVLPNNPASMHPGRNRNELTQKRNRLLQRLQENGVLDAMQLQLAQAEPLVQKPRPLPRLAPHLLATLKTRYPNTSQFRTTVNYARQNRLNDLVANHALWLAPQGIHNAAVLVLDNRSFEVVAYAGNSPASGKHKGHAVDLIHRPRSTGSILKPLLFAGMLQSGEIVSTSLVPDVPARFNGYRPENYDRSYRGAVPAKEALARSLNIPAVLMLQRHGIGKFYDFLQRMGMSTLFRSPDGYGLTLILGGAEGSLWELTQMYANMAYIARQDQRHYDRNYLQAKVLQSQNTQGQYPWEIQAGAAWLTLQALNDVNRPGEENNWRSFSSSQKIAWKTGTSYGLRDAWAIGSNQRYTVGVWVGNADGEGKAGLTGLSAAAPLLFDVFNSLPQTPWFSKPEALLKQVSVCKKDGLLSNGHCQTEAQWAPVEAPFQQVSRRFKRVHLDTQGQWQVHSRCESTANMQHRNWFVLPPVQAFYYKHHHLDYKPLPDFRADCRQVSAGFNTFEILSPQVGAQIYIPVDLGERREKTLLEAKHKDSEATLYWHLNEEYLGETQVFHQMAVDLTPGKYRLTIVDQNGAEQHRRFEILGLTRVAESNVMLP
ncbi:MAG: penicillin-binding protein 1C [Gammaproteobacteria bacterium]|nr:penicillin-binding protein 1C [Gammaproteobacteria bacterium]MDH5802207.1 penicillin-binding protein 1C [Gammaproteobacteria bacterium]